jgi:glycerol-1-phosphate dehydrogenase [NAD(P)+]
LASLEIDRCVSAWPSADAAEAQVRSLFAKTDFVETAVTETRAKHVSPKELRGQLEQLRRCWPATRERLREQLLSSAEMKSRLELVGAPAEPEQIGISRERLRASFVRAYHIRRRFTVLDVAVRTNMLDSLLDGLFGPSAVWAVDANATQGTAV